MDFWNDKSVCITGGAGFLGSHIVDRLKARGCARIFVPRSRDYDLREREAIRRMFVDAQPDVVIHAAAVVGGIGANQLNPGRFLYENAIMGLQLIDEAKAQGIRKFVQLGTVCAYPKFAPVPFREEDLWNGFPEETNAPYGIAKKLLLLQCQAYRTQYGFNSIYLLPVNLYGPRDNFDLGSSHVIPALIRKCLEASQRGERQITVWGTGSATREFLHVSDCAEAVLLATEFYDKPDPVNLGSGVEVSIRELVDMIGRLSGFKGEIIWDHSKPDGQPRRRLDISRAEKEFGFRAHTSLEEGIRETVDWYSRTHLHDVAGSMRA
jgi:GDP-L-fucose synthase